MWRYFLFTFGVLLHHTHDTHAQGVPTDPGTASAIIGQSIAAAVQEVQQNNAREAQMDGLGGTTSGGQGFGPGISRGTNGQPTVASPFRSALWHHSRFSRGADPERVAMLAQNAEITLAAERNFNDATGSAVGTLASTPNLLADFRRQIEPFCPLPAPLPVCNPNARYRNADGTCNNLNNPLWGSSFRAFKRYLPPAYDDGLSVPRTRSVLGGPLPSAREVSNAVHNIGQNTDQSHLTVMFMAFGQFRDHDYTSTPIVRGPNNEFLVCCPASPTNPPSCFPIRVPLGDPKGVDCMTFVRSSAATNPACDPGPREQTNQLTGYLDASSVYGSDQEEQDILREFSGGRLAVSPGNLLPEETQPASCIVDNPSHFCFNAGDKRNSEIVTLTPSHIIFLREHNRIAGELQRLNPHWLDERIFQETRKIVTAILQHITYAEYVPIMLGPSVTSIFGLRPSRSGFRNVYSPNVDGTVANSFATAAFRYGHSQIPTNIKRIDASFNVVEDVPLETQFDRPRFMFEFNGLEDTTRFEITERQPLEDRRLGNTVREALFVDEAGDAFDLASLNIQRGRDHGLPSYNRWRQFCGFRPAFHFGPGIFGLQNHNFETRNLLQQVYRHPEDIDLFTGGLSEERLPGALVGPTFACLLGRQFFDSQRGDRFYYENDSPLTGFTARQLREIKRVTLASVICANVNIQAVQSDVFRPPSFRNRLIPCRFHRQMNLNYWREQSNSGY